ADGLGGRREAPDPMHGSQPKLGPHSRTLCRGAIGRSIDGRSAEGRFLRDFDARMSQHVGGRPSAAERLLISRLARVALRLELFDEKLATGAITDHDARVYGALHNGFRLMLRELGIKAAPAPALTLAEVLAAGRADRDAAA